MSYSVLMSVYAREKPAYLEKAIQSMLDQTVPTDDFVLVCDGPLTDGLYAVIDAFCEKHPHLFRIIRLEENVGLGAALAEGVGACKNEYIARMDSDDISLPDRIERQLQAIGQNEALSAVGAQIAEFQSDPVKIDGYRTVPTSHGDILKRLRTRNPMNHVTVLMKRSAVLAAGNYQSVIGFEDYHLWTRMLALGQRFANIGDVGCFVRIDGMHKRRGGMPYFKNYMQVARLMRANKMLSYPRYIVNACVRFSASVLCPDFLKKILFKIAMRKKHVHNT